MQVEYFRCWAGGEGDRGQWDTDYIEIPDNTPMSRMNDAIGDACRKMKWQNDEPPALVGLYSIPAPDDEDEDGEREVVRVPRIELNFHGMFSGVEIPEARDKMNEPVDVSGIDSAELVRRLKEGDLFLRLEDILNADCIDGEVEIFGYEVTPDE